MPKLQVTIADATSQALHAALEALRAKRKMGEIPLHVLREASHHAQMGRMEKAQEVVKPWIKPLPTMPVLVETLILEALDARAEKERKEKTLHPVGAKIRTDSGK